MRQDVYCVRLAEGLSPLQAGGKAANLARVSSAGLSVPDGFVVTRDALAFFLEAADLSGPLSGYLAAAAKGPFSEGREKFESLCDLTNAARIPAELVVAVAPFAADLLAGSPWGLAVRSSAVCEDSTHASFAGVFESYLGVQSLDQLWDRIKQCWCASWSPAAIAYARRMGLEPQPDQMAVLVQRLVPADAAGVIFTANPTTGNPWEFVVNATLGLAQDLVTGKAPADHFMLEWDSGTVIERRFAAKPTMLSAAPDGLTTVQIAPELQEASALSDEELAHLRSVALEIDREFDARVDLEWVLSQGELAIVQVRPITSLPEFFPHTLSVEDAKETWGGRPWCTSVEPGSNQVAPLFADTWLSERWRRYSADTLRHQGFRERDLHGHRYETPWLSVRARLEGAEMEAWLDVHEPELRRAWLTGKKEMESVAGQDWMGAAGRCSVRELIAELLHARERALDLEALIFGPSQTLCRESRLLMWGCNIGDPHPLLAVCSPFWHARTAEALALGRGIDEDVVRQAFREQPLAGVVPWLQAHAPDCRFLRDYESYCWKFGLVPPSWSSRPPRWRRGFHTPSQSLLAVRNGLLGRGHDPDTLLARQEQIRRETEDRARAVIRQRDSGMLPRFEKLLEWMQFWRMAVDDRKLHERTQFNFFELAWQTGVSLQREGLLDAPQEILLLTVEDLAGIRAADDLGACRALCAEREHEYERNRRLSPPRLLGTPPPEAASGKEEAPTSEPSPELETERKRVFQGSAAVPGKVTGRARVATSVEDLAFLDQLSQDDILVCPCGAVTFYTDWLSLLVLVKGMVTYIRWQWLHHAAQVARECGIVYLSLEDEDPGVIPDGAMIELDGDKGTVTVLEQ